MSLSAVPAHVVFFIGAIMISGAFVSTNTETVQGIADSILVQANTDAEALRTSLHFVNDPGNIPNDPVVLYLLNTGTRTLHPSLIVVLVDGDVVTDRTVTELGTVDQAWQPGEIVRVTIATALPMGDHHFRAGHPPDTFATFRPWMSGPNVPPVASFTYTTTPLTINVDASSSTDANLDTLAYAWTYGDSGTGIGVTDSHTYAAAGSYTVNLTVSDGKGGTDWVEQVVPIYLDFLHTHEIAMRLTGQHVRSTVTVFGYDEVLEASATVDAEICKSGGTCTTYSGTTKVDGTVEFTWSSIGAGTYTTCVTGLAKTDMWWDQSAGHATDGGGNCRTQTL